MSTFNNLCSLAATDPRANIKLRVNFDPETLTRVPELLEMVPVELRKHMHIVLERIFGQGVLFINKTVKQVALETEQCYELARKLGYAITAAPLDPGKLTYCYADRVSQFLFNHDGDVFKCTVGKFTEKERLGFLDDHGHVVWEGTSYDDWMAVPVMDDQCYSCTYLPMCYGRLPQDPPFHRYEQRRLHPALRRPRHPGAAALHRRARKRQPAIRIQPYVRRQP